MASGKPVISTPRGGIGEVVADQSSGFLLPPKDWNKELPTIWEVLWSVPNMRLEMGKQALMRARQFSWHATAQGYIRVFEATLGKEQNAEEQLRKAS
jgi:spore coat protein SA